MYTPNTTPAAQERSELAVKCLLGIEIAFGALAFWSDAIAKNTAPHYVVALLLTVAFGAVSLLASAVVTRFAEAEGHKLTRAFVLISGGVLVLVAGGMTWHGLSWADAMVELAPAGFDWILPVAAYGLSTLNVIALYVFCRDLRRRPALQLVHDEQPAKDPHAQAMANKRWANR